MTLAPPRVVLSPAEQVRLVALRRGRRRAGALLAAVTVIFLGVTAFGSHAGWAGWVEAGAVASMVGGLADWFAVTALFRHPLGLPLPHTAIVAERKEQFGAVLGTFVEERFLTAGILTERARAADVIGRAAGWLAAPEHAQALAGEVAGASVRAADLLHDDEVHAAMAEVLRRGAASLPLAPLAGRLLRRVLLEGRHRPLLSAALAGAARMLETHAEDLRRRVDEGTPWWLPGRVEDRLFDRMIERASVVLQEMAADPEHPLRLSLEARLASLARDLQHDPQLAQRVQAAVGEVLDGEALRGLAGPLWEHAKEELRAQAGQAGSGLRLWLADALCRAAGRVASDPALRRGLDRALEQALAQMAERFRGEAAKLVAGTVARWDAAETSARLELLLGPDLQYIRINGTVVGALAGLAIHGVALVL